MKRFSTSYVYLSALIAAVFSGLFARISINMFLLWLLTIAGHYLYYYNQEHKVEGKRE